MFRLFIISSTLVLLCLFSNQVYSQKGKNIPHRRIKFEVSSGVHKSNKQQTKIKEEDLAAYKTNIHVPNAARIRVVFGDYNLSNNSYIELTSLFDGGTQRLDKKAIKLWHNTSAIFNGDELEIKLFVLENDSNVFFNIRELIVGEIQSATGTESLCDTDDRTPSTDPRVGRLNMGMDGWCTVWLGTNGAVLTAGHCVDWDPDGSGPNLPDGTLDLNNSHIVEFDVPNSTINGVLVAAAPDDQYLIDLSSVEWNFDGSGQGLGKDWAVFACEENTGTELTPHQAQNDFIRFTRNSPNENSDTRVTGHGADDGTRNATQQTEVGNYLEEHSSGSDFWHEYIVDTRGGNSGSPIIWEANNDFSIGIHTNGGCNPPNAGNNGTSFEHDPLEIALNNILGSNTIYVDLLSLAPTETGSVLSPYNTISEGINATPSGGRLYITNGTYNNSGTLLINKSMTILPPATGSVIIRP